MVNRDELIQKIRNGNFKENNGHILRAMTLIRGQYITLKNIMYALSDLKESEMVESIDFLQEEGYIRLRGIEGKKEVTLADADPMTLEAKLTGKGDRLLRGEFRDQMVDV